MLNYNNNNNKKSELRQKTVPKWFAPRTRMVERKAKTTVGEANIGYIQKFNSTGCKKSDKLALDVSLRFGVSCVLVNTVGGKALTKIRKLSLLQSR